MSEVNTRAAKPSTDAFDQSTYQIRFDWGHTGLTTLAPAHVTVVVDALAVDGGGAARSIADAAVHLSGSSIESLLDDTGADRSPEPLVVIASLTNRAAVARLILDAQIAAGGRTSVNVVAVGEVRPDGSERFAVEDQIAAGAVIDALIELGIDHTSPDAAAACAAFSGLRRAVKHILSATASGRLMRSAGRAAELAEASVVDGSEAVTVVRESVNA